jgi:hypothetical protein
MPFFKETTDEIKQDFRKSILPIEIKTMYLENIYEKLKQFDTEKIKYLLSSEGLSIYEVSKIADKFDSHIKSLDTKEQSKFLNSFKSIFDMYNRISLERKKTPALTNLSK